MRQLSILTRLLLVAANLVVLPVWAQSTDSGLRTTVTVADPARLLVRFSLHNDNKEEIRVLAWNSPFEQSFNADFFDVTFETRGVSHDVEYLSRHVKRGDAAANEYVALAAGDSVSVELDVSHGYDVNAAGFYNIRFNGVLRYYAAIDDFSELRVVTLQSNTVLARQASALPTLNQLQTPSFNSCDASQQAIIDTSLVAAEELAITAHEALTTTPVSDRPNAARYTNWFGSYLSSRYSSVTTNFAAIQSAIVNETMQFVCNSDRCDRGTYAFVYSNSPHEIYLCDSFWTAPVTGTDSQAGTIIHELSHFNIVAGTDDHQYGQSAARALASSNPNLAIDNADSHEYFAENTPALSMSGGSVSTPDVTVDSEGLTLGQPTSGTLTEGQWAYYEVTGASEIVLYHLTGDLDLYIGVGGPPTASLYVCRPFSSSTISESCNVDATGTTYIGVNAYTSGSFSLIANAADVGSDTWIGTLSVGQAVSGSVEAGEWDYFQVSGADSVLLYQLSADADLYIGDGGLPTESSFTCRPFWSGASNETCSIDSNTQVYIGVRGWRSAASYSLIATVSEPDSGNPELSLDVPVMGSLAEGEWAYYQVTGADLISLTGLTADLDLYIGDGQNPTTSSFQCRPYFGGTMNEFCTVSSDATTFIGVNGFAAGSFTLEARSAGNTTGQMILPGETVTGTLSVGEWDYYRITGASEILLDHLTGDLDLYIGIDGPPTASLYQCRPFSSGIASESCSVDTTGITYIGVNGYTGGSYTLSSVAAAGTGDVIIEALPPGVPVAGELSTGQWVYYLVSGVDTVTLSDLSGDLDLYIQSGGIPTETNFLCRPYLGGTNSETCTVSTRDVIIIGVNAFQSGSFSLVANLGLDSQPSEALIVELNQSDYVAGDPLVATMTLSADTLIDTYVGFVMPTGDVFTLSPTAGISAPNTLLAYHTNLQVNGQQTHTVLNVALPSGLQTGVYQFCAVVIEAGVSLEDGNWNALQCVPFTIGGGASKQDPKAAKDLWKRK